MVTPIRTPHRSKPGMALALLALIAAIAYIVAPIDFDGPIALYMAKSTISASSWRHSAMHRANLSIL